MPYVATCALVLAVAVALIVGVATLQVGVSLAGWLIGLGATQFDGPAAHRALAALALGVLVGAMWLTYRLSRAAYSKTAAAALRFGMRREDNPGI